MKIWLEKPAVNILQLTGGKNEKVRRGEGGGGLIWKTSVRFIFCLQETLNGNQNNWICDMSTTGFQIEILLHIYNVQQTEVISGFYYYFYYSQVMRTVGRSFYCFRMRCQERSPPWGVRVRVGDRIRD